MSTGERQPGWIDVYPFSGRDLSIVNTGDRFSINPELAKFIEENWRPKAEKGWSSSWVAFAKEVVFDSDKVAIKAGAMPFHVIDGIDKAIEEKKPFAPSCGFVNCLSVGFVTATSDNNIIFQRRGPDVHVPNTMIQEPCGYMASLMFSPRENCDNPQYADDKRLFDIVFQLEARKKQLTEAFGVDPREITYDPLQDFLAAGWLSTEMYFSTTGRVEVESTDLRIPARTEILFVPFDELRYLIANQGKLAKIDRADYKPNDPRQIPLIDESLLGLLYGYKKLTGDNSLDIEEVIDRLNYDGLNIRVFDTGSGKKYQFPTSF